MCSFEPKTQRVVNNYSTGGGQHNSTLTVSNVVTRCYNCGSKTHQVKDCPDLNKGPKLFLCRSFGHRSTDYPKREFVPKNEARKASVNNDNKNAQVYQVIATSYHTRVFKEIKI